MAAIFKRVIISIRNCLTINYCALLLHAEFDEAVLLQYSVMNFHCKNTCRQIDILTYIDVLVLFTEYYTRVTVHPVYRQSTNGNILRAGCPASSPGSMNPRVTTALKAKHERPVIDQEHVCLSIWHRELYWAIIGNL